jgi:hypothetical protein
MHKRILVITACLAICCVAGFVPGSPLSRPAQAQTPETTQSNQDAHAHMNERGEVGMGFSQTATTHHFFLKPNGGALQV